MPQGPSDASNDSSGEVNLLSFIVRIWKEESTSPDHQTIWRGHITFIPNGERHYFASINEIASLINSHLGSE